MGVVRDVGSDGIESGDGGDAEHHKAECNEIKAQCHEREDTEEEGEGEYLLRTDFVDLETDRIAQKCLGEVEKYDEKGNIGSLDAALFGFDKEKGAVKEKEDEGEIEEECREQFPICLEVKISLFCLARCIFDKKSNDQYRQHTRQKRPSEDLPKERLTLSQKVE